MSSVPQSLKRILGVPEEHHEEADRGPFVIMLKGPADILWFDSGRHQVSTVLCLRLIDAWRYNYLGDAQKRLELLQRANGAWLSMRIVPLEVAIFLTST